MFSSFYLNDIVYWELVFAHKDQSIKLTDKLHHNERYITQKVNLMLIYLMKSGRNYNRIIEYEVGAVNRKK